MGIVSNRWDSQRDQKLYGAAYFLNPKRFFELKSDLANRRLCTKLRHMFNEVLWKMVPDEAKQSKISSQSDDYVREEGECFSSKLAQADKTKKNPCKHPLFLFFFVSIWLGVSVSTCLFLLFFGGQLMEALLLSSKL